MFTGRIFDSISNMADDLQPQKVEKKKKSWLRYFLKLSEGTEIPEMFSIWCGLASISAALRRSVWIDMGVYRVYPNMFIILVAGSGRCRKSTAIGLCEGLLHALKPSPNIIAQKITPEALIEAMTVTGVGTDGEIKIVGGACDGFVIVDELSTFLNRRSYEAGLASMLIPLYDCKEKFEYMTKGRGKEVLFNTCLGLLGGSTIEWIRSAIPEDAIGGGLTSRMVFIYEKVPPPPVAWTEYTEAQRIVKGRLVEALSSIGEVRGAVKLTEDAIEAYKKEYDRFYHQSGFYGNKLLQGYASRRHVHLLKVGMMLAMAEGPTRVIEPRHLQGAKELLEVSEKNMPEVMSLIVASETGEMVARVMETILKLGKVSRGELMRRFSHRIGAREMHEVLSTLILSGQIKHERGDGGGDCFYSGRG